MNSLEYTMISREGDLAVESGSVLSNDRGQFGWQDLSALRVLHVFDSAN